MVALKRVWRVIGCGLFAPVLLSGSAAADLGPLSALLRHADSGAEAAGSLRKGVEDLTPEEEYYIGRAVAAQLLASYYPVKNRRLTQYLNQVGGYLAEFSGRPETFAGYHFQLITSDEVNAFAAPGGFILVTTGLFRLLESEDQLAAVLAHEIGHVNLLHGLGAIQQANLTQAYLLIGKAVVSEGAGSDIGALAGVFGASVDDIVSRMAVSGYSREQEYAADRFAVELLYRSGYDPAALGEFLRTLAQRGGKGGFFSTHPPAAERLQRVEQELMATPGAPDKEAMRRERFAAYRLR